MKLLDPKIALAAAASIVLAACSSPGATPPAAPPAAAPAASSSSAGPVAPAGGHGLRAFLDSYDANRDGQVTRAEYDAIRKQRFDAADSNHDGVLSEDEYVAEYGARLKRQYFDQGRQPDAAYDASIKQAHVRYGIVNRARDGRYTRQEDNAIAERTFKGMDTNGDGVVSTADPQRAPASRDEAN